GPDPSTPATGASGHRPVERLIPGVRADLAVHGEALGALERAHQHLVLVAEQPVVPVLSQVGLALAHRPAAARELGPELLEPFTGAAALEHAAVVAGHRPVGGGLPPEPVAFGEREVVAGTGAWAPGWGLPLRCLLRLRDGPGQVRPAATPRRGLGEDSVADHPVQLVAGAGRAHEVPVALDGPGDRRRGFHQPLAQLPDRV